MRAFTLSLLALAAGSTSASRLQKRQGFIARENNSVQQGDGTVSASLASGDSVTVYQHGATVTSWKTSDGDERLFLSSTSALNGSAAIRGGIPVVFPNFGSAVANSSAVGLPSHGFARNSTWTYVGHEGTDEAVTLLFTLTSEDLIPKYKASWPYKVSLSYNVTLEKDNLSVNFKVDNVDQKDVDFQFLLHSYLTTPNINTTTVFGLKGSTYQDKTQNYTVFTEQSDAVAITNEMDRIYTVPDTTAPIVLSVDGEPRTYVSRSASLPDVTVWNLWSANILKNSYADFSPKDAWQHYLAIEPGAVAQWPGSVVKPGESWSAGVHYRGA